MSEPKFPTSAVIAKIFERARAKKEKEKETTMSKHNFDFGDYVSAVSCGSRRYGYVLDLNQDKVFCVLKTESCWDTHWFEERFVDPMPEIAKNYSEGAGCIVVKENRNRLCYGHWVLLEKNDGGSVLANTSGQIETWSGILRDPVTAWVVQDKKEEKKKEKKKKEDTPKKVEKGTADEEPLVFGDGNAKVSVFSDYVELREVFQWPDMPDRLKNRLFHDNSEGMEISFRTDSVKLKKMYFEHCCDE